MSTSQKLNKDRWKDLSSLKLVEGRCERLIRFDNKCEQHGYDNLSNQSFANILQNQKASAFNRNNSKCVETVPNKSNDLQPI
jgi:hypothetical protein